MKTITIITSTRAEYGLLRPLIKRLLDDGKVCPKVVATGAHLLKEFGETVKEIEKDSSELGFEIDEKIDIFSGVKGDSPADISRIMGQSVTLFGEYFDRKRSDAIVVLGDRYEMLSVCSAAMNARIPIIHIHGGETTQGAVDEAVRHSITKMSQLHFTSTEAYRKRVIQLGENPSRVFNVGALGVENACKVDIMPRDELEKSINSARLNVAERSQKGAVILGDRYAVGTFHPVTLEDDSADQQTKELLAALEQYPDITYLFTKAGADAGGRKVNEILAKYAAEHDNFYLVDSLGMRRYLSAVKGALFVIGNSSSGIIEVPSFHVPTINIGDRQKGRVAAESVIYCGTDQKSIVAAIDKALDASFRESIKYTGNPYEKEGTSKMMAEIIEKFILEDRLDLKKSFYDVEFET
ncbi:GDP/UDP-N,N'-diacetylbacillosamine 2-epimerase (hydrolysing) [Butyrivibrio sp. ob235]|uniref:UDP-N-acetylglucosamine 2-epimerase n=1 Tax=Butyrivibrio sp. ob235 TaxID=1761780 RepID=UPI0008AC253C|nr:UDP-N-acetylglucosamine 2-epimerase [Butyrivibrio sp. ob235]SEM25133.1 GDP/UDP-N,N'-diacetylbacillosamine 2-epimerase (hydrolysing) [Butyrivibrio sp. ob235]